MSKLTLEDAKEICKDIKALNGSAVLLGEIAPMISSTGLILKEDQFELAQKKVAVKGLMIVKCPEHPDFEEGQRVTIIPENEPLYSTAITTKEVLEDIPEVLKEQLTKKEGRFETLNEAQIQDYYKKYVVFVYHPITFAAIVG